MYRLHWRTAADDSFSSYVTLAYCTTINVACFYGYTTIYKFTIATRSLLRYHNGITQHHTVQRRSAAQRCDKV